MRWGRLLPWGLLLVAHTTWAQAGAVKAPKAAQVVKQVTGITGRMLGLKGPGRALFALAVVLLILLGFYLWKRKKNASAKPEVSAASVAVSREPETSASAGELMKVWNGFLHRLPRVFRRSIHNFQPFVVMGPAASGKTTVISTYSDWERQARQGLPSETQSPLLQAFLSSQAVLVEMPAALLQDTSVMARRACTKLFSRLAWGRSPVVAVVLDLPALQKMSPEAARALADGLRAKVNILATARKRRAGRQPVEVRLVLTHLDSIAGFESLVEFAQLQDIPLRFPIGLGPDESPMAVQVADGVSGFGAYLPLALTKLSSSRYKEVVVFLREGPQYFENLGPFLTALFARDSLSQQPSADDVYLATDREIGLSSNPFHVAGDPLQDQVRRPMSVHAIAAYGLGALLASWMLLGYGLERQLWQDAAVAMTSAAPETFSPDVRSAVRAFRYRDQTFLRLLPGFYGQADETVDGRLSRNLREFELVPRLQAAIQTGSWRHRRALNLLALIHSSRGSELAKTAQKLADGPLGRDIGRDLIADYISATREPYPEKLPLDALRLAGIPAQAFELGPWKLFLQDVGAATKMDYVRVDELVALQVRARKLQRDIEAIRHYGLSDEILGKLPKFYHEDFKDRRADFDAVALESSLLEPMSALLELVDTSVLELVSGGRLADNAGTDSGRSGKIGGSVPADQWALRALSNGLRTISEESDASRFFRIALTPGAGGSAKNALSQAPASGELPGKGDGEEAVVLAACIDGASEGIQCGIDGSQWKRLIRKVRINDLVEAFKKHGAEPQAHANELFFRQGLSLASISVETLASCASKAAIKVGLDGHYTSLAFNIHVRPALLEFLEATGRLDGLLPEAELLGLRANVRRKVMEYAARYQESIHGFYTRGFLLCAGRGDALAVAFGELAQATSNLTAFLDIVNSNTNLNFGSESDGALQGELAELLKPLSTVLAPYRAIQKVVHSAPGVPRELDTYLLIMETVRARLAAGAEPMMAAPGELGLAGMLKDQLRPAGQIALERVTTPAENAVQLVADWLAKMGLEGAMARPFRMATRALRHAGDADLKRVIAEVWDREVLLHIAPLMRKFPFSQTAKAEVTSLELEQAFHPKEGLVFDRYHRFFEPVTRVMRGAYAPRRGGPPLPRNLIPLLNRIAVLTNALWDEKGVAKPLAIRVRAIPFEPTRDMRSALTLAYLRFGDVSIFNFNQKPSTKALVLPWDAPQISQVGVQLTNARNGKQRYPRSLVTAPSHFSALRLLKLAKTPALGATYRESDGHVLTERRWEIPYAVGPGDEASPPAPSGAQGPAAVAGNEFLGARFLVEERLLDMFDFAELARDGEQRFATLTAERAQ